MSLINQMLKDLDARRTDGGSSPFGEQVRAVPDRQGIHPAWWLAMALGLMLVGVVGWVLLRPAPAQSYAVRAQLPLRLDAGLRSPLIPAAPAQAPAPAGIPLASASASIPASDPAPPEQSGAAPASSAASKSEASSVERDSPPVTAASPSGISASGKTAVGFGAPSAPQPHSAVPSPAVADESPPAPISKQVRELTPQQQAENAFRKGTLALQRGRKTEAQGGFEEALRLEPRHAAARQALIAVLIDAGRTDEALRQARKGVELDRHQTGLAMILARLSMEQNDLDGALAALEGAQPHADGRSDFVAFHAALLQRAGRHRAAAEQYLLALRQAPQNGLWWMGLGISLQASQRNAEAREAFQRARGSNALSPELAAFVDQRLAELK